MVIIVTINPAETKLAVETLINHGFGFYQIIGILVVMPIVLGLFIAWILTKYLIK